MRRRQPRPIAIPRSWMMTDERQGQDLWAALQRLPRGAGLVFRHYGLPRKERRDLFMRVARIARRRGCLVLLAGSNPGIGRGHYDGRHGGRRNEPPFSASAHNLKELRAAERQGARCVFLSPVFPTRSHPSGTTLRPLGFRSIAREARIPVIALGGVNAVRSKRLRGAADGWAGIDAWSERSEK